MVCSLTACVYIFDHSSCGTVGPSTSSVICLGVGKQVKDFAFVAKSRRGYAVLLCVFFVTPEGYGV